MKRSSLNFLVDLIGFLLLVFLIATGVLMRYVLPPGSGPFRTIWSLDRHSWGDFHFWVAVFFLAVLAIHLFLHWHWIVNVVRGKKKEVSGARFVLGCISVLALIALFFAPVASPIEGTPAKRTLSHEAQSIRGSMTLAEVEKQTGVSAKHIVNALGLPADTPINERLGPLKRAYGFEMEDVRRVVSKAAK